MTAFEFEKRTNTVRCGQGERKFTLPSYAIGNMGSPNSITVRLGFTCYRALVDTEVEISVINRVY